MVSCCWLLAAGTLPGCGNNIRDDRIKFQPDISVRPGKMGKCIILLYIPETGAMNAARCDF